MMAENFIKLVTHTKSQTQEAHRKPSRTNTTHRHTFKYILFKFMKMKDREKKNLKVSQRGKKTPYLQRNKHKNLYNLSETNQAERKCNNTA